MSNTRNIDIYDGQLENEDVDFWEIEGVPVAQVFDGKTGVIALAETPYKFPRELLDSYHGRKLEREQFFKLFPDTLRYFEPQQKRAVAGSK